MKAVSRLVGADQVYTARDGLAVYVVDVAGGWVTFDIYAGTTREERARLPRRTFNQLFTNYSFNGGVDADSQDAGAVGVELPGRAAVPGGACVLSVGAADGVSS